MELLELTVAFTLRCLSYLLASLSFAVWLIVVSPWLLASCHRVPFCLSVFKGGIGRMTAKLAAKTNGYWWVREICHWHKLLLLLLLLFYFLGCVHCFKSLHWSWNIWNLFYECKWTLSNNHTPQQIVFALQRKCFAQLEEHPCTPEGFVVLSLVLGDF